MRDDGRDPAFESDRLLVERCCGGHLVWAVNEEHLSYLERFVRSTDRTGEFPSPPGRRQLADRLPKWLQAAEHRDELGAAFGRLRDRLSG